MKQIRIAGNLLKCLALAGFLTACNNDQTIAPTETPDLSISDQNARISPLLRLVNDGGHTIQYVKSGKFFGKISKVHKGPSNDYYVTYNYNDSNPSGELWISKKKYQSNSNAFIGEHKFKVVNGVCVQSQNDAGESFEYKYNPQGYLIEIIKSDQGLVVESWNYKYDFINRLSIIEHKNGGVMDHKYHITYEPIQDKYPLNIELGIKDKYLPIFGKNKNPVIHEIKDTSAKGTFSHIYYADHKTDSDGLVISKMIIQKSATWTETISYSDNWQGLPGNP